MNLMFSRRKILTAGGAALVAQAVLTGKPVEADTTPLSTNDRAVLAVQGSDAGFSAAVEALYPGLLSDPFFKKIAPLAILVTHQKGPSIRAQSVRWTITTAAGKYRAARFYYVSPGSASKGYSVSTLRSARQPILRPGESRLITPFFNWTPAYYGANPAPHWNALMGTEHAKFMLLEFAHSTKVRVALDGVVFSDWKILGADKNNLTRRLRSRRNAEHDEASVVSKLLKSGATDAEIHTVLQAHGSAPRSTYLTPPGRWYQQARRFQAQVLLRAFQEAPRAAFTTALTRLRKTKSTVITRAVA